MNECKSTLQDKESTDKSFMDFNFFHFFRFFRFLFVFTFYDSLLKNSLVSDKFEKMPNEKIIQATKKEKKKDDKRTMSASLTYVSKKSKVK